MSTDYEAVIGLEVHAQLTTRTKIFCGCSTGFGDPPNSHTCPVCLGHPGALPVMNAEALRLALRAALALHCEIRATSTFARKNYFYPDLPKGYQISQYDEPIASGGEVEIEVGDAARRIGLRRVHLEEDAGKLLHEGGSGESRVDLNRAGVPLIEIVTRPEIGSPDEAYRFLQRLKSILLYAEVCDGNMEQGSLRCDANVSLRRPGEPLGTRTELKNLNSFRNVQRALVFEIERQRAVLEAGQTVRQQTVLWDADTGTTRPMRGKEEEHDYRYFPDPDLRPLQVPAGWIESERASLPELPAARKRRLQAEYAVGETEAHQLTLEVDLAGVFEATARASGNPRSAANFLLNDWLAARNRDDSVRLSPERLAELIRLVDAGTISATAARQDVFPEMVASDRSAADIVRDRGLSQVSDEDALLELVRTAVAEHPDQVAAYRGGKTGLAGWFVGRVMRASRGRANPRTVDALVRRVLDEEPEA